MNPTATSRHFRRSAPRKRAGRARLTVELLEQRNLLDGGLANVLVNDPTADYPWVSTYPDGTQQLWPADTQSETAIALAGNRIVVAYNDDNHWRGAETFPPTEELHSLGYAVSKDGGKTFKDMGSLPDDPTHPEMWDPVLDFSNKTGTTFLISHSGNTITRTVGEQINVYRSVDNGSSFSNAIDGTPGFTAGVDLQDKPWVAVDNFAGPDGSGYGNTYLAWTDFSYENGKTGLYFTRSIDDGMHWGPNGGTLIARGQNSGNAGPIDAFVTVGKDHAVYVFWLDYYGLSLQMRKSTDQGATFGDPVTVAKVQKQSHKGDLGLTDNLGRNIRADSAPYVVVNPANGDLYLVYADKPSNSKDHADIFFVQSTDGGQSWSRPQRVNDDPTLNDQWNPALAVTPDGSHVGVFWYDRRLDPANNLIDRYGVIGSASGHGVNFGSNFRITDVSFPSAFDPYLGPDYMGDYDQAVADNGYFYTTWGDNRLANPNYPARTNQPDVRFAKIPVGWAGEVSSLAAPAGPDGTLTSRPAVIDSTAFALPSGVTAPSGPTQPGALWTDTRLQSTLGGSNADALFALVDTLTTRSAGTAQALIFAAAATGPGTLLSREAPWKDQAVDAYFMDLVP
jgi:hypothetical protein